MVDIPQRTLQNAYKVAYLVKSYPDKPLNGKHDKEGRVEEPGILDLIALPPIDINAAMWAAIERGWLAKLNPKSKRIPILELPDSWHFGEAQENLQELIVYAFHQLGEQETDLEEYSLNQWLQGYPSHEFLIAMKYLLDTEQLAEYELEDGENKYLFYTLYANRDKLWGRKQFKEDPLQTTKKHKK